MKHLSEAQVTAWMLGEQDAQAKQHLDQCLLCRSEIEELRGALAGFRQSIHGAVTDRAFEYRTWQNAAVSPDAVKMPALPWRLIQAGALATMVLLTSLVLTFGPRMGGPVSPGAGLQASREIVPRQDISDEALLLDVQNAVREQVPAALAPAQLIAEERDRVIESRVSRQSRQATSTQIKQD